WASGGDFGQGFITGAGIEAFNHLDIGQMIEKGVDEKLEKMHSDPGSTYNKTTKKICQLVKKSDPAFQAAKGSAVFLLKKTGAIGMKTAGSTIGFILDPPGPWWDSELH
ncbi:MAG: hypothetical protein GY730_03530, partial [bacterium]|nr:hypothetical protein [bacterium]